MTVPERSGESEPEQDAGANVAGAGMTVPEHSATASYICMRSIS